MKTETILKTDVLDILFNNKNKDYGAYELRKHYPARLKKSLLVTTSLVLVFAVLQSWKTPKVTVTLNVGDPIELAAFNDEKVEKKKLIEIAKPIAKEKVATVQHTNIVIVKETPQTTVPTTNSIDSAAIATTNNNGIATTAVNTTPINTSNAGGNGTSLDTTTKLATDEEPIFSPSVMPQFEGGLEALKRFMLQNLQQPNDIEQSDKIVVIAQFVIDKSGDISNIEIVQSGRDDLDKEVIRVINKMPSWKPGMQNGFPVAVYFKMPISFVNND